MQTDPTIKLRADMTDLLSINMTSLARIRKTAPGATTPEQLKKLTAGYKDFVKKLSADTTKTDQNKMLIASRKASDTIERVLETLDIEKGQATALRNHHEERVANTLKVGGTTDLIVRQMQLNLVTNLSWSEALSLITSGCAETAKCMELPFAKAKFNLLTDSKRMGALKAAGEEAILGAADNTALTQAREIDAAFTYAGEALLSQHAHCVDTANKIQETIVEGEA